MYGGDEVSAIVVDLGTHTCKAGYAGEDALKTVFPSRVIASDIKESVCRAPDTPYDENLRLKGTKKGLRFSTVKGIWSIRDDLAVPPAPYTPMPEVRAAQGPPPMVLEGIRNLTSQLFQHRIIRCGGEVNDEMATLLVAQLLHFDAIDPKKAVDTKTEQLKGNLN